MSRRRDRPEPRERRSPNATIAPHSNDFIEELNIPTLPEGIPQRLEEAVRARVDALLYELREAKKKSYVEILELRLVREAYYAVIVAYELKLPESEVYYATFRRLVEELGYERADVGFVRVDDHQDTP